MLPLTLTLVRHGQSEGNVATKRSRGGNHKDYTLDFLARHSSLWRLTPKGCDQAAAAGEWIKAHIGTEFFRYCVSDYVRALETAAYLDLPDARWYRDIYLRERDWGVIDVVSFEKRETHFKEIFDLKAVAGFYWAPPGGESMAILCERADRVLGTLHRECEGKDVVMVLHGETMWAMRFRIERMALRRYQELDRSDDPFDKIHNCQIIRYTRQNPEDPAEILPYMGWMMSVNPWDPSLSRNEWEPITRKAFTNEELLAEVEETTPLVKC